MAAEIFYAEDGEIYICPIGTDLDAAGAATGARLRYKYSDYVTEIAVSAGGRDIETIYTFGKTSGAQNTMSRELPQEDYETTVTAIVRDAGFNEMVAGTGSNYTAKTTPTAGVITVSGATTRSQRDIYYRYDDGTSQIQIKFANAYGVSNEMSSDAEGYLEETTGFKCNASDYQKKYSADRTVGSCFAWSGEFA
jgi:hypothetical protein